MTNVRHFGASIAERMKPTALLSAALAIASLGHSPDSQAGATFKIDDTKWISIGLGLRTSFSSLSGGSGLTDNKSSNNFNIDNMRIYLNAQLHEYFKLEFNTDCQTCNDGGEVRVLDAIAKFDVHPLFNVWVGRMLVPAERREMNGPFFSPTYMPFASAGDSSQNGFITGTPFVSADFFPVFAGGGISAGSFGRDDGVTAWGEFYEKRLKYAFGFFNGLNGGANHDANLLYAQRVAYNFLDVEKNPGYYTSGTYYGKGGDILTLAATNQYQEEGAGNRLNPGNLRATSVDLLFEMPFDKGDAGVITFNGEYKNYGIHGYDMAARLADKANGYANSFPMFEGNAIDTSLMYLIPNKVWIGQFQPYVRYVEVAPINSPDRNMFEGGVNYVIDGHNLRISLLGQYGSLLTKGLDYTTTATGGNSTAISLGFQMQI